MVGAKVGSLARKLQTPSVHEGCGGRRVKGERLGRISRSPKRREGALGLFALLSPPPHPQKKDRAERPSKSATGLNRLKGCFEKGRFRSRRAFYLNKHFLQLTLGKGHGGGGGPSLGRATLLRPPPPPPYSQLPDEQEPSSAPLPTQPPRSVSARRYCETSLPAANWFFFFFFFFPLPSTGGGEK